MRFARIRLTDGLPVRHARTRDDRPARLPQRVTTADDVRDPPGSTRRPLGCDGERALEATDLCAGRSPSGVVGSGGPDHALTRTFRARATKAGALPSGRVLLHAHRRYYDPLGLPLRDARFRHRLIRATLPRPGRRRRVSPVPHQTVHACRPPYPGEPCDAVPGRVRRRPGLHRAVRGSALPLFLCRGGRVHLMLRPACLLPPLRLLTPRYRPSSLEHKPGPATRRSGPCLDGTHTRWSGGTFRTHHARSLLTGSVRAAALGSRCDPIAKSGCTWM